MKDEHYMEREIKMNKHKMKNIITYKKKVVKILRSTQSIENSKEIVRHQRMTALTDKVVNSTQIHIYTTTNHLTD